MDTIAASITAKKIRPVGAGRISMLGTIYKGKYI
jgi:hypothetical protein